ncbi:hypothetical protein Jann_1280 [Jannaschia sp. CCS1]|nr:hypothetical protein Jann_1280 [Jannaschia sp. CCS1]
MGHVLQSFRNAAGTSAPTVKHPFKLKKVTTTPARLINVNKWVRDVGAISSPAPHGRKINAVSLRDIDITQRSVAKGPVIWIKNMRTAWESTVSQRVEFRRNCLGTVRENGVVHEDCPRVWTIGLHAPIYVFHFSEQYRQGAAAKHPITCRVNWPKQTRNVGLNVGPNLNAGYFFYNPDI